MKPIALVLIAVLAVSCAQQQPQPAAKPQTPPSATPSAPQKDAKNTPAATPSDANWTILCTVLSGPNHVAQGAALKAHLVQNSGMRDWYVIHAEGATTLYYGHYRTIDEKQDKREAERARGEQKAISGLVDKSAGARMFPQAFLVPLDSPDPPAPPEWNLVNAKGYYTLQIGVCKGDASRKQLAVDAVREARAQGYEAYFYHGPTASSVCIGTWAETAVRKETNIKARNPNDVLVAMPEGLPVKEGTRVGPDGSVVEVVKPKTEILDMSLAAMMRAFPTCAVNGVEERKVKDSRTGQVRVEREPSLLVVIPRETPGTRLLPTEAEGSTVRVNENPMAPAKGGTAAGKGTAQPKAPTGGKLRGLEE